MELRSFPGTSAAGKYFSPVHVHSFHPGQAIRGGIPVIFPQFGPGPGLWHGFARLLEWVPGTAAATPNRVSLELSESNQSWEWWPHCFHAKVEVQLFDDRLSTSLTITNRDEAAFEFTATLHTYLRVSNIEDAEVLGLHEQHYIDAGKGNRLEFLQDASNTVYIRSEGFTDTVVWNPGAELAAGLGDLGPGNHAHFVCMEAAKVKTPVIVAPGMTWRGAQTPVCPD